MTRPGLGNYTEPGQVIPVTFKGPAVDYVHAMYLNDDAPWSAAVKSGAFPRSWQSQNYAPTRIPS